MLWFSEIRPLGTSNDRKAVAAKKVMSIFGFLGWLRDRFDEDPTALTEWEDTEPGTGPMISAPQNIQNVATFNGETMGPSWDHHGTIISSICIYHLQNSVF